MFHHAIQWPYYRGNSTDHVYVVVAVRQRSLLLAVMLCNVLTLSDAVAQGIMAPMAPQFAKRAPPPPAAVVRQYAHETSKRTRSSQPRTDFATTVSTVTCVFACMSSFKIPCLLCGKRGRR